MTRTTRTEIFGHVIFEISKQADRQTDRPQTDMLITIIRYMLNKKHLKNVGLIRHCEPPHALILHCHSPGVATVARRLRIDVHDNDDNNNDNA